MLGGFVTSISTLRPDFLDTVKSARNVDRAEGTLAGTVIGDTGAVDADTASVIVPVMEVIVRSAVVCPAAKRTVSHSRTSRNTRSAAGWR